ncbi:MAG: PP2C family protein-serine/threonine phosphatase [Fusobacteriota bacterium]
MRKDNSDLVTNYTSEAGTYKKNRDYFAYVELDKYACWVLADGIDSAEDNLSAELAVGSVIKDFTEKPEMKKRSVKKYIKNANKLLLYESREVKLTASITIVVSNYSTAIYGSTGNTRLYHFRKDKINKKSKDFSIAYMMSEVGEITENSINRHVERNNLTEYLGQKSSIKYDIGKIKLKDNDVLTLCSAGFWENISNRDLEDALKEAEGVEEYIETMENVVLEEANKDLDNYTISSIFINKVFKEKVKAKKGTIKKIATFLIPILILTGGYAFYTKYKNAQVKQIAKMQAKKAAKLKQQKELKKKLEEKKKKEEKKKSENKAYEKGMISKEKGDIFFENQKYIKAKEEYGNSLEAFKKLNEKDKIESITSKIETIDIILTGKNNEETGDENFKNKQYQVALDEYKKAKILYTDIKTYRLQEINTKIKKSNNILLGISKENAGDQYLQNERYKNSYESYKKAKDFYNEVESYQLENITVKISKLEDILSGIEKEKEGNIYIESSNYSMAIDKYNQAYILYEKHDNIRIENLKLKLQEVRNLKNAKELEKDAAYQEERQNYSESITLYEQAGEKYSEGNSDLKYTEMINKVTYIKKLQEALAFEKEGQNAYNQGLFTITKEKYGEALKIYKNLELTQKSIDLKEKQDMVQLEINLQNDISKIKELEAEALNLFKLEEYNDSKEKYELAKEKYLELDLTRHVSEVEDSLKKVRKAIAMEKALNYEEIGDLDAEEKEYEKALKSYNLAKNIYSEIKSEKKLISIRKKISKTKDKKDKFLFIF